MRSVRSCHHEPSHSMSQGLRFSHCKMHALANASHHCPKWGRHAVSRRERSKQTLPRFPQAGADSRQAPIQPSPPQPASTYFFSPSKSKNDSKAGGAFILAPCSSSQTPTRKPPSAPKPDHFRVTQPQPIRVSTWSPPPGGPDDLTQAQARPGGGGETASCAHASV